MSTHVCEVTLFLLRQLGVISYLKPESLHSYSQMQGHTMMFIRQKFGNSPSGWCEERLRSKFSLGLYRLLGFAWIDGNTGLSTIDPLKMNACALSCELMAWGLDLWPQKKLWDVRGSGISRFLILKSAMLTFERLLIMADSFGVLADTHQKVKHTSLWEVYVTICSYTACLDLQTTWSYSSFRTGMRGFNLVSEGEIWCSEEGGGRLSHCESDWIPAPFVHWILIKWVTSFPQVSSQWDSQYKASLNALGLCLVFCMIFSSSSNKEMKTGSGSVNATKQSAQWGKSTAGLGCLWRLP